MGCPILGTRLWWIECAAFQDSIRPWTFPGRFLQKTRTQCLEAVWKNLEVEQLDQEKYLTSRVFLRYSLFSSRTPSSEKSRVKFNAGKPISFIFSRVAWTKGITFFMYFFSSALLDNSDDIILFSGRPLFACGIENQLKLVGVFFLFKKYLVELFHTRENRWLPGWEASSYPDHGMAWFFNSLHIYVFFATSWCQMVLEMKP